MEPEKKERIKNIIKWIVCASLGIAAVILIIEYLWIVIAAMGFPTFLSEVLKSGGK